MNGYYQTDLEVIAAFLQDVVKPHLRNTEFDTIRGALVLSKDADMPVQKLTPPPTINAKEYKHGSYACANIYDPTWMK